MIYFVVFRQPRFNLKRELLNVWELIHMACPATDPLFSLKFMFWCEAYGRSNVQAKMLDRILLNKTKLSELPSSGSRKSPALIIGTTDLRTGELLGFTRDFLFRIPQSTSRGDLIYGKLPRMPRYVTPDELGSLKELAVSEIVAGSSAFPGAINSIMLKREEDDNNTTTVLNIADGGLTDNYGLSLLLAADKARPAEWKQKLIIVSDGSMPLKFVDKLGGFSEFIRGMDVVYASSGFDDFDINDGSPKVLRLSPVNLKPHFAQDGKLELKALSKDRLDKLFNRLSGALKKRVKSPEELKIDIERSVATFLKPQHCKISSANQSRLI